jgi:hypothetical protein
MTRLKYLLVFVLCITLTFWVSWRVAWKRGFDAGVDTEARNFQVMLDANVYWSHRDALWLIAAEGQGFAFRQEMSRLNDAFKTIDSIDPKNLRGNTRVNFYDSIRSQHQDLVEELNQLAEKSSLSKKNRTEADQRRPEQSIARPGSEPEGSDKPRLESEERSR